MSPGPQSTILPDGKRLHLNHGPIDLIIGAEGGDRGKAFADAAQRFDTVLTGLVSELEGLQSPFANQLFCDPIAKRMANAVAPFAKQTFVTPMAAVAGAVADEMLLAIQAGGSYDKLYINNGGDIAFDLQGEQTMIAATAAGNMTLTSNDPIRGIATSGWRGRSQSRGIADAVTVLARTAAAADAAATLIANAVDLPGHPAIERRPGNDIECHSELKDILVTVAVGPLSGDDVDLALARGMSFAKDCVERGLIEGALMCLQGETRVI